MIFKEAEQKMGYDIKIIGEKLYPNEKVELSFEKGIMHMYTNIKNTNSCEGNFDIRGMFNEKDNFYKITHFFVMNKSNGKAQEILNIIINFCKDNLIPKLVITNPNDCMIKFLEKNNFVISKTYEKAYESITI